MFRTEFLKVPGDTAGFLNKLADVVGLKPGFSERLRGLSGVASDDSAWDKTA